MDLWDGVVLRRLLCGIAGWWTGLLCVFAYYLLFGVIVAAITSNILLGVLVLYTMAALLYVFLLSSAPFGLMLPLVLGFLFSIILFSLCSI